MHYGYGFNYVIMPSKRAGLKYYSNYGKEMNHIETKD